VNKTVFLSLGSNIGDRLANLQQGVTRLSEVGDVTATSAVYETEPVEFTAQPWFLNCAVKLTTEKMPRQLLEALLKIEKSMGRQRHQSKGPRKIDIDILLFGNSVVNAAGLTIPHPAMHERRFVLEPLAEIGGMVRHPIFKRTVSQMLEDLGEGPSVRRFQNSGRKSGY